MYPPPSLPPPWKRSLSSSLVPPQVWSLPPIGAPPGSQTTTQAQLRVSLEDASPVRTLLPIGRGRYSGGGTTAGPGALLALGGGPEEEPDGLALLPLPYPGGGGGEEEGEEAADEREVVRLRWVGHVLGLALVPPPGAIGCGEWRGGAGRAGYPFARALVYAIGFRPVWLTSVGQHLAWPPLPCTSWSRCGRPLPLLFSLRVVRSL